MKASILCLIAGAAALAHAHATIFNILVNDVDQGLGSGASGYIRSPPSNGPLRDITSSDMTCNVNNVPARNTVSVAGGDKITFQWHHNTNTASDDIIDPSHKGPILVYIAPTPSNGAGNVWVKLYEDGYQGTTWAVTKLINDRGRHSLILPDLAPGEYLLRPELIAHHESYTAHNVNPSLGAQFYMACVQIKVTSSGSKTLPAGVAIPGVYTYSDPGIVFDLYNGFTSYKIPGGPVWDGASGSAQAPPDPVATAAEESSSPTAENEPTSPPAAGTVPTPPPAAGTVPDPAAVATPTQPASFPGAPFPTEDCDRPVPTTFLTRPYPPPAAATNVNGVVAKYGRCGGQGFGGSTTCETGSTCQYKNPYYSQCL